MRSKLLTCLFLASGLILNPLAKNHTNATKPKPCFEESSTSDTPNSDTDDSLASETLPDSDENKEATSDIEPDSSIYSDTDEECSLSKFERLTVGRHLNNRGKKADGTESHHIVSSLLCKDLDLNLNNAPTVCFSIRLHQRTGSHPSSGHSAEYHIAERTILCNAIGVPETISDDELRETFSRMMPMQKYNCLKKVLDLGLSDLEESCNVRLRSDPSCMKKIDAELQRLAGLPSSGNPLFTPKKGTSIKAVRKRRKSTTSTPLKRQRRMSPANILAIDLPN